MTQAEFPTEGVVLTHLLRESESLTARGTSIAMCWEQASTASME